MLSTSSLTTAGRMPVCSSRMVTPTSRKSTATKPYNTLAAGLTFILSSSDGFHILGEAIFFFRSSFITLRRSYACHQDSTSCPEYTSLPLRRKEIRRKLANSDDLKQNEPAQ